MKEHIPAANMTEEVNLTTDQNSTTLTLASTEAAVNQSTLATDTSDNTSATTSTNAAADTAAGNVDALLSNFVDITYMSAAFVPVATDGAEASISSPATPNLLAIVPGEPGHMVKLKTAIIATIVNPEFIKDSKKVEKLTELFAVVDPETRVRAQLETNAYKTLRAKAAKKAEEPGGIYVAPTQAEINKYIEDGLKVWRDKQK